jgi:hypothetical protein
MARLVFVPEGREVDIALAEFDALRAEILSFHQGQAGSIAAALTASAALGALALNPTGGRLELLLVLPFVLGGLGFLHTDLNRRIHLLGRYIETQLWQEGGVLRDWSSQLPSWEQYNRHDMEEQGKAHSLSAAIPVILIFFLPSVASLAVGFYELAFGTWANPLWWLFGTGCVVVLIQVVVALSVIRARRRTLALV